MISSRLWPHFALEARYGCAFQHRAVSHTQSIPRTSGQGRVAATVASMQRSGIEGRRRPPTTVAATHATTAGDGSWRRNRGRFAAAIGKGGIVVGLGGVCPAACVATSAFRQPSGLPWGFEVHCLADWGNFARTKCLTRSLDSTSLHRGYVGCAGALADSLLAALLAREAGPCSPWLHWLLSLAGAACRATFTFRRHLRVACMLAMSIDLHATH